MGYALDVHDLEDHEAHAYVLIASEISEQEHKAMKSKRKR